MRKKPSWTGLVPLLEEVRELPSCLSTRWGYNEKLAVCSLEEVPHQMPAMLSDFQSSEWWEINVSCFKSTQAVAFCYNSPRWLWLNSGWQSSSSGAKGRVGTIGQLMQEQSSGPVQPSPILGLQIQFLHLENWTGNTDTSFPSLLDSDNAVRHKHPTVWFSSHSCCLLGDMWFSFPIHKLCIWQTPNFWVTFG